MDQYMIDLVDSRNNGTELLLLCFTNPMTWNIVTTLRAYDDFQAGTHLRHLFKMNPRIRSSLLPHEKRFSGTYKHPWIEIDWFCMQAV